MIFFTKNPDNPGFHWVHFSTIYDGNYPDGVLDFSPPFNPGKKKGKLLFCL